MDYPTEIGKVLNA